MVHRLGTVAGTDIEQCAYSRICHSISVHLPDIEVWVGHSPQCVDVVGIFLGLGCRCLFRHAGDECCCYGVPGFLASRFPALIRASWHAGYTGSGYPYNGDSSFSEIFGCERADTSRLVACPRIFLFCPYRYAVVENRDKYPAYCDLHYGCWGDKKERIKGLRIRNWWKIIH